MKMKLFNSSLSLSGDKKYPTMSIRKHANELKVHRKTVRTAIKHDLNPDLNLLNYNIWGVLENKTNATSHRNINSLKTVIEKEWNIMYSEYISKECKSFRKHVDKTIEKNGGHIE